MRNENKKVGVRGNEEARIEVTGQSVPYGKTYSTGYVNAQNAFLYHQVLQEVLIGS